MAGLLQQSEANGRIRGPCVEVFVRAGSVRYGNTIRENGIMPLHETLQRTREEGRVLVSNAKMDQLINPNAARLAAGMTWENMSRLSFEWTKLIHDESYVRYAHTYPTVLTGTLIAH